MTHSHHPSLPHYVPEAVLHAGCPECEYRATLGLDALQWFDEERLRRAFERAARLNAQGATVPSEQAIDGLLVIDPLELNLLRQVAKIQSLVQRAINMVPTERDYLTRRWQTTAPLWLLPGVRS